MKSFITWLYQKFVYVPTLRSMSLQEQAEFVMVKNQIDLIPGSEIEMVRSIVEYVDAVENGPDLKLVRS